MITVRKATPSDVLTVVDYIKKKADFDRQLGCFNGELGTTAERIAKALFELPVFAYAILASHSDLTTGFAFFHYHFSSFQARPRLWLDDLYVDANARRLGVGAALMSSLADVAAAHDCTDLAWVAARNNPSGIPFYTKLGAKKILELENGFTYSITPASLSARISEIQAPDSEAGGKTQHLLTQPQLKASSVPSALIPPTA
jgi:GNAT superfamily N-acetyltransferase